MSEFGEIDQNGHFGTKMAIFGLFWGKNGGNKIFYKNPQMSLPYTHKDATLCKKHPMNGF